MSDERRLDGAVRGRPQAGGGAKGVQYVAWHQPAGSGGVPVASYDVVVTERGVPTHQRATRSGRCTLRGLLNGRSVRITVQARNTAGLLGPRAVTVLVLPPVT
jgi:hypothetical protein